MRNSFILAGAAALAFTVPALAQPGKGNGGNKGGGNAPAKVERGGGGQQAQRGGGQQQRTVKRGGEQRAARQERPQRVEQREVRREVRAERKQVEGRGRSEQREVRAQNNNRPVRDMKGREARGGEERNVIRNVLSSEDRTNYLRSPAFRSTGLINNCPPGLAAKNNGCLPPGQAKKLVGAAVPATLGAALLPALARSWYPDDERYLYRTDDGYIYRIDRERNLVDGFFPLAPDYTGAYYVGAAYPQDYLGYYNVPAPYRPLYADNGDQYYRYGDGSIYRVDRQDGLITAIVSLLAGDLGVGQPLPAGYDVYNVPYDYRQRYADGPDAWYRYNDGNIYRIDPTTRLVQAIVETLL